MSIQSGGTWSLKSRIDLDQPYESFRPFSLTTSSEDAQTVVDISSYMSEANKITLIVQVAENNNIWDVNYISDIYPLKSKIAVKLFSFKIGLGILAKSENSLTKCSMFLICLLIVFK